MSLNQGDEEEMRRSKKEVPSVVLVRKHYPRMRKKKQRRLWKLKHLAKEAGEPEGANEKKRGKGGKRDKGDRGAKDLEDFLNDVEEDRELRAQVNVY